MNRRVVITGLGGLAVLGAGGYGLRQQAAGRYAEAAAACRLPLNLAATGPERLAEIVRFACLAPNSHNTQGWIFTPVPDGVRLQVEPARRTPVVDPDDHHLFVSLGCAAETLMIAATAYGLTVTPDIAPDGNITFTFADDGAAPSALLPAIPLRQCNRGIYDATKLTEADRAALLAADGALRLIEDIATTTALRDQTTAAYGAQMGDAAYRAELLAWQRFSEAAAMQMQDGLFAGCSGSYALPQWLGRQLFPLVVTRQGQMEALSAQMASAAALALFVTLDDTPVGRIDTGRRVQRVALAATLAGLAHAHVNPALEDPDGRVGVARICGLTTGRPSILLRLGRAAPMPYSLRRPPSHVLLS